MLAILSKAREVLINEVIVSAQLACVLEVACPKPGNVNRYQDYDDTKFEHFLAGSIAIGSSIRQAAIRGFKAGNRRLSSKDIGIGTLIKDAVLESRKWHGNRNTNLGIAMLLVPLSSSCGLTIAKHGKIKNKYLKENLQRIVKNTTSKDALEIYDLLRMVKPGGLGKVDYMDIMDERSLRIIEEEDMNLYDIMKISKDDSIASELTGKMKISFEVGYPNITGMYKNSGDINKAILYSFLHILSNVPDSLIAKKNGMKVAKEISHEAGKVLSKGMDPRLLNEFDRRLRGNKNSLNPGTTADLVTSSLMIALLNGLRI